VGDRARRLDVFLDSAGWGRAGRAALAGDASFRRYLRLDDGRRRAVLMDAPPSCEDTRPFVALARHLRRLGLSAPEILAEDNRNGFLILEDLGDATYMSILNGAANGQPDESTLYALAVDVLIHLHRLAPDDAVPAGLAPYDDGALIDEANLLIDWALPAARGHATTDDARHSYAEAWRAALAPLHGQPRTLVLRDYHVDNLMWLAGRHGVAACGLLDFQDALAGPAAYDLMSLLEDARRDIDPALIDAMKTRYRAAFPGLDRQGFDDSYAILAAQRHAKVIGIFTRLDRRDGKPGYLIHLPRVWRLLEGALRHPALAPVADWFERHVPPAARTAAS
jgi:hypothetical protein